MRQDGIHSILARGRRAVRYCQRNNPGCLTQTFPGDLGDDCVCSWTGAERERPYIFLLP